MSIGFVKFYFQTRLSNFINYDYDILFKIQMRQPLRMTAYSETRFLSAGAHYDMGHSNP